MAATTDFVDVLSEQVTSGMGQAREINLAVLEVARAFTALLRPDISASVPLDGSTFAFPAFPQGIPSATDAIDQVFRFAGMVLELQHEYLVRVAETMMPSAPIERA